MGNKLDADTLNLQKMKQADLKPMFMFSVYVLLQVKKEAHTVWPEFIMTITIMITSLDFAAE